MEIVNVRRVEVRAFRVRVGLIENAGKIDFRSPLCDLMFPCPQTVGASDHFGNGAEAQRRHNFPQLLRDELHEVHYVFRLAGKTLS